MAQTGETTLQTESRIKQEERLKAEKEPGITPRKIQKHIEVGNDDSGEDLSGLGKDASNFLGGVTPEDLESSDDGDENFFMPMPPILADARAKLIRHCAVAMPRYEQLR